MQVYNEISKECDFVLLETECNTKSTSKVNYYVS